MNGEAKMESEHPDRWKLNATGEVTELAFATLFFQVFIVCLLILFLCMSLPV